MGVPDMVLLCDTGLTVCFSLQVCHTSQLTLSTVFFIALSIFATTKNSEKIEQGIVHKKQ